jgi:hypothetical protein
LEPTSLLTKEHSFDHDAMAGEGAASCSSDVDEDLLTLADFVALRTARERVAPTSATAAAA